MLSRHALGYDATSVILRTEHTTSVCIDDGGELTSIYSPAINQVEFRITVLLVRVLHLALLKLDGRLLRRDALVGQVFWVDLQGYTLHVGRGLARILDLLLVYFLLQSIVRVYAEVVGG